MGLPRIEINEYPARIIVSAEGKKIISKYFFSLDANLLIFYQSFVNLLVVLNKIVLLTSIQLAASPGFLTILIKTIPLT